MLCECSRAQGKRDTPIKGTATQTLCKLAGKQDLFDLQSGQHDSSACRVPPRLTSHCLRGLLRQNHGEELCSWRACSGPRSTPS